MSDSPIFENIDPKSTSGPPTAAQVSGGIPIPAVRLLQVMSSDEWEEFTEEWLMFHKANGMYHSIQRSTDHSFSLKYWIIRLSIIERLFRRSLTLQRRSRSARSANGSPPETPPQATIVWCLSKMSLLPCPGCGGGRIASLSNPGLCPRYTCEGPHADPYHRPKHGFHHIRRGVRLWGTGRGRR